MLLLAVVCVLHSVGHLRTVVGGGGAGGGGGHLGRAQRVLSLPPPVHLKYPFVGSPFTANTLFSLMALAPQNLRVPPLKEVVPSGPVSPKNTASSF